MSNPLLRATDIEKSLGSELILRGIDLTVQPGQILVLVGPNGAGKTILLCALAGGLEPDTGQVEIDGLESGSGRRRSMSFLPQGSMAVDHLTGRENARFYTSLHPARSGRWATLVEEFGLIDDIDATVRTYSGGMRRKLELAIAMDPDVPLYLLDEPTAGVDLTKMARFQDLLLGETDAGAGVVLSSHTPLDMELADTIAVIRGGRIETIGPPDRLLDAVPDVLRLRGRVGRLRDVVQEHLLGGRVFVRGDELRGFLRPTADPTRVEQFLEDDQDLVDVRVETASFADLFNYHTDRALLEAIESAPEVTG